MTVVVGLIEIVAYTLATIAVLRIVSLWARDVKRDWLFATILFGTTATILVGLYLVGLHVASYAATVQTYHVVCAP